MGLQRVEIFQFSRLNMVYTLLSKHKLLWFVQNHKVDDWTAPFYNSRYVTLYLKIEALTIYT
jgi:glutamyl-tRNA synthetase